jgi:hypothetical protein
VLAATLSARAEAVKTRCHPFGQSGRCSARHDRRKRLPSEQPAHSQPRSGPSRCAGGGRFRLLAALSTACPLALARDDLRERRSISRSHPLSVAEQASEEAFPAHLVLVRSGREWRRRVRARFQTRARPTSAGQGRRSRPSARYSSVAVTTHREPGRPVQAAVSPSDPRVAFWATRDQRATGLERAVEVADYAPLVLLQLGGSPVCPAPGISQSAFGGRAAA